LNEFLAELVPQQKQISSLRYEMEIVRDMLRM